MHTHCEYSPDSRTPVAVQVRAITASGLDVVCATDHNTIDGALRLRELAVGFRVVIGEEVSSRDGEIIGLFLEHAVPRDLSAEETIARIHGQGGLVSVPHPFSHNRIHHLRRDTLERVWPTIDAIEIFNATRRSPRTIAAQGRSRRRTTSRVRWGATRIAPGSSAERTSSATTSPVATTSSRRCAADGRRDGWRATPSISGPVTTS